MDLLVEVKKAQSGDNMAMVKICQQFEGLVKKYAYKAYLKTITEEVLAEGYLALVEAIKTFKFDKNVNFAGYADSKVKFAIWNLFKRYKQQWEHEESAQQEINESCMLDYLSADIDIAEEFTQQMMKEKLKVEILKLPQKQQEVLRLNMVEGYSLTAVAKLWHVSPQYVYNIKKRALQNLKTVLV